MHVFRGTRREGARATQPLLVDDDHFAGFDFAYVLGADQVEARRFARHDDRVVRHLADTERSNPHGVPNGDHLLVGHAQERVRALNLGERVGHAIFDRALRADGHEVNDDLRVAAALKDRTSRLESFTLRIGVREVAVVRDGDGAARIVDSDRLRVLEHRSARGRIANVTDRVRPFQLVDLVLGDDVDDVAHASVRA